MAVSPSASGLPAVLAALTGADSSATLNAGDVIAARVSAQLSGELARLLFRGGAIDVKLPAPLPPGSEVVFQVQQGGSAPTITILRATPAASTPQTGATPATIVTTSQPAPVAPSVPVPGGSAPQASPPSPAVAAGPVLTATSASQAAAQPSQQTQLSAQPQSTVPSGSSAPALPPSSNPPPASPLPQATAALVQGQARYRVGPQAPGAAEAETVPPAATSNRPGLPPHAEAAVAAAKSDSAVKQSGLAGLFAEADAVLRLAPVRNAIPTPVTAAIVRLLGLRVSGDAPDAAALRQAIERSGVQTEALLARGQPVGTDMKTALQTLRQALADWVGRDAGSPLPENRSPPPQRGAPLHGEPPRSMSFAGEPQEAARHLLARVDGALHRIRLLQIASLPDRADPAADTPEMMVEIPIAVAGGTGTVQMRLARERRTKDGRAEKGWRVRFSLEPGEAGPTHASVGLAGDRVDVSLYAENESMAETLRAGLDELQASLEAAGLASGEITARTGKPRPQATPSGFFLDRRS